MTLVIPERLVSELERLFEASPLESAGVLLCREASEATGATKLLAHEFLPYAADDYLERRSDRIVIDPDAVNNRIQRAKRLNLGILQVHTHPLTDAPTFSDIDIAGEQQMMPVFHRRVPGHHHGSLLLGRRFWCARVYATPREVASARILSIGTRIEHLNWSTTEQEERFSRTYLVLGKDGQAALQGTRACIVGLGGLGSHVAQQLAYLGVKNVVLIDHDYIDESNLNRVVGAIPSDVGRPKVDVAAERYRAVLPDALAEPIRGSVLDEHIARRILSCDVALCCTDNHGSRAVINWVAYQYLVPTIDMGVEIRLDKDSHVDAIAGRLQLVGPGAPCLYCCQSLDANRVREDFLTPEERAQDQYIQGAAVPQPAVVSFNGVVASLATSMLLGMTTTVSIASRMQTVNFLTGRVSPAEASIQEDCPVCSNASTILGQGDATGCIWRRAA